MTTDGIRINGLHSQTDFDLSIKARNIGLPSKKTIRQTVPFMNGYYDFGALNGSPNWDERSIQYTFELIADTPTELESYVERVLDWLCNVHDADIFDDTMPNYHWHGSYESCAPTWDDSGMQCILAVTFTVHPFKISSVPTVITMTAGSYTVKNHGMAVAPIVLSNAAAAIQIGNYVTSIPANEEIKLTIDLARGDNTVIVTGNGVLQFKFYAEVL